MHCISNSRNSISPTGRPFMMFNMPEIYGTRDYLCTLPADSLNVVKDLCLFQNLPCDREVCELALILMNENGLSIPKDHLNAVDTYIILRSKMLEHL